MEFDEPQKFVLYTLGTGFLLIILACFIQFCLIPGAECRIPFFNFGPDKSFIYSNAPDLDLEENGDYQAILHTNYGDITIDLLESSTPVTVNNFVFLSDEGYYEDVKFHLVDKDVVIQTGDRNSIDNNPENDGLGGPGYIFEDEVNWDSIDMPQQQRDELTALGFSNDPGVVSVPPTKYAVLMANSGEGDTNGSQFFIVTLPADDTRLLALRGLHTVFGVVIDGFDVVEEINNIETETESNPGVPTPVDDIEIEYIDVVEIIDGSVYVNGKKSSTSVKSNNVNL